MSRAQRATSILGLLTGALLLVVIAFSPDGGPNPTSVALGLGIGAIVAAAPTAALVSGGPSSTLVAMGGAMTVAGAATTPGGNLAGWVMALAGLVLLASGTAGTAEPTWRLVGSMLAYAGVLYIGMYAALVAGPGPAVALVLAAGVASSPRWLPDRVGPPFE